MFQKTVAVPQEDKSRKLSTAYVVYFVLTLSPVQAQFEFGVLAGAQYTPTSITPAPVAGSIENRLQATNGFGYLGGVHLAYALNDRWALRTEICYDRRVHSVDVAYDTTLVFMGFPISGSFNSRSRIERDYLHLPVLLTYVPVKWFSATGGAACSYLLSSSVFTTGDLDLNVLGFGFNQPITTSSSSTAGLRSALFHAVAGVGFHPHERIDLLFTYWLPLTDLEENADAGTTRQQLLRFSLGYCLIGRQGS